MVKEQHNRDRSAPIRGWATRPAAQASSSADPGLDSCLVIDPARRVDR